MTKIGRFAKYQLSYYTTAVPIFFGIFVLLGLFTHSPGSGNSMGGSGIFIFILGLNWFKTSFRFSQANNLPRRVFYLGTLLAIVALAAILSIVTTILDGVLSGGIAIGLYRQIYPANLLAQLLWNWVSAVAAASAGWMISMLYYRSSLPMKIIVSLSPVLVIWLFNQIHRHTGGKFWFSLLDLFKRAFGLVGETANPYPAILSFTMLAIVICAACGALMYRAPVKN